MTEISGSSEPTRPPLVRLAKGQEVNLGCGAVIIIAIIVAVCSGAGKTDLEPVMRKLDQLDQRIQALEKKVDEINKKPQQ
jgi:outer membrane murein-binding lipoprotein Lpp